MTTTAIAVTSPQTKPITRAQLAKRLERAALKIGGMPEAAERRGIATDPKQDNLAWDLEAALMDAAVWIGAAGERGNPRAERDLANGQKAIARAMRLAGVNPALAAAVKMLGVAA